MGVSGGKQSSSSKQNASTVWGPQAGYLQDMYGRAQGMMGSTNTAAGDQAYQQAQGYGDMMGGAAQQALGPQWLQQAQQTTQQMQNPGTDPRMAMYAKQVGQNFNEQVMPALQGQAMTAGGYGGSRAGIAQGLAGARAGQQIQDFGAQLYGENQDRALQAANLNANIFGQGMQGAAQAQQGALQSGEFGMGVPWYNLQQYAGLLGGPTVLGGGGSSKSSGWNANISGGA